LVFSGRAIVVVFLVVVFYRAAPCRSVVIKLHEASNQVNA